MRRLDHEQKPTAPRTHESMTVTSFLEVIAETQLILDAGGRRSAAGAGRRRDRSFRQARAPADTLVPNELASPSRSGRETMAMSPLSTRISTALFNSRRHASFDQDEKRTAVPMGRAAIEPATLGLSIPRLRVNTSPPSSSSRSAGISTPIRRPITRR